LPCIYNSLFTCMAGIDFLFRDNPKWDCSIALAGKKTVIG